MGYGRVKMLQRAYDEYDELMDHASEKGLFGAIGSTLFGLVATAMTGGLAAPWVVGTVAGVASTVGMKVGMDAAGDTPDTLFNKGTAKEIDDMDSTEVLGANFLTSAFTAGFGQYQALKAQGVAPKWGFGAPEGGSPLDWSDSAAGAMLGRVKTNKMARKAGYKPWGADREFVKDLYEFNPDQVEKILSKIETHPGITSGMDPSMIYGAMETPTGAGYEFPEIPQMFNDDGSINRSSAAYKHHWERFQAEGMSQTAFERMMKDSYGTISSQKVTGYEGINPSTDKEWWEPGHRGTYTTKYDEPVYIPSSDPNAGLLEGGIYKGRSKSNMHPTSLDKLYGGKGGSWVYDSSYYRNKG